MDQLLPGFDREVSEYLRRIMERRGAKIFLNSTVSEIKISNDKVKAIVNIKDGIKEIEVDKVLLSVGRKPNIEGLNIENVKVARNNKGFIITDEFQRTNISNIYAIGDITGPPFLAHRASKQGIIAAEVISGLKSAYDYRAIPSVYFTDPEFVTVGLNQGEIKDREILIGKFPFTALGRALAYGTSEGFVKIIADKKTNVILGVQAIGEGVSDLSGEIALALEMGATLEDLSFVMHPHPTLTEAIMEAAENALKKAIHILNK
jgi:dihydrolipoamide dehydrogenase